MAAARQVYETDAFFLAASANAAKRYFDQLCRRAMECSSNSRGNDDPSFIDRRPRPKACRRGFGRVHGWSRSSVSAQSWELFRPSARRARIGCRGLSGGNGAATGRGRRRGGWQCFRCDRGPFHVIEGWVENESMVEILPPEFAAEYLAFTRPDKIAAAMAAAAPRPPPPPHSACWSGGR